MGKTSATKLAYDKTYNRDNCVSVTIKLHKVYDADLIAFLAVNKAPGRGRSRLIKDLLRNQMIFV